MLNSLHLTGYMNLPIKSCQILYTIVYDILRSNHGNESENIVIIHLYIHVWIKINTMNKELIIRSSSDNVDFALLKDGKLIELQKMKIKQIFCW